MSISYRAKRRFQTLGIVTLLLVLILTLVWLVWLLWLDRYVVYDSQGVKLDFSASAEHMNGELALPPPTGETIDIYYNEGSDEVQQTTELTRMQGFYADAGMLRKEMDLVVSRLQQLPPETPVMLDVKDISGRFYYSTALDAETDPNMDIQAVDAVIELLDKQNLYAIARVPAFRDRLYGLHNVPDGLYHTSGKYLWMDGSRCYWLNPTRDGTMSYLMEIVAELKALGFDEVVFDDFRFPETDQIRFNGDKAEALKNAALQLEAACATKSFAVSFVSNSADFPLPDGRTRLYLKDIAAADVVTVLEGLVMEDPAARVVFFTDSRDTRFESYSLLRPINSEIMDIPQPTEAP